MLAEEGWKEAISRSVVGLHQVNIWVNLVCPGRMFVTKVALMLTWQPGTSRAPTLIHGCHYIWCSLITVYLLQVGFIFLYRTCSKCIKSLGVDPRGQYLIIGSTHDATSTFVTRHKYLWSASYTSVPLKFKDVSSRFHITWSQGEQFCSPSLQILRIST